MKVTPRRGGSMTKSARTAASSATRSSSASAGEAGRGASGLTGPGDIDALSRLAAAIRRGERRALARAVTLVESTRPDHRAAAEALLGLLLPGPAATIRLGISGVPGVGKSTFIE